MAAREHIGKLALAFGLSLGTFVSWTFPDAAAQTPPVDAVLSAAVPGDVAARRLERAQVLLKLKNYPAAATLLWDVVALGPQPDELTYREALYILGEALYQQGEQRTSQRIFTQLVDLKPPSSRVALGLTRLLELGAELGGDERADEWIERLSRLEGEAPPSSVYVKGRYLLLRKRYADARAALAQLPPGSAHALRARYLVGAALTAESKLDEAEAEFSAIVKEPLPASDDERRAVEQSWMALGRIYHAARKSDKAHDAYLRISQKSDLFRDAIYEAAWSAIATSEYERAEQALELLLLAYRDAHQTSYAATEAKMLLGNLLLRRGEPEKALTFFEQAKQDATPVVETLSEKLARPEPEKLSALIAEDARGFDLDKLVPRAALPLLTSDFEVGRFLAMQRELRTLTVAVQELERSVGQLEKQGDKNTPELQLLIGKERDAAQAYRQTLSQTQREAAQLGGALLSAAGQSAHKKFAEVLMRAEAGILDVAWARKVRHSEKLADLGRQEKRDLRILDDEFGGPRNDTETTAPIPEKPVEKAPEKAPEKPAVELPPGVPADVAEDVQRYLETAETFRNTLVELGQEGYTRRRREVLTEFAEKLRSEEALERETRIAAIAQFEQFLTRYPSHPRFTPDAMFRLAELYFERSSDEFASVVKKQNDGGEVSGLPDYGPSVELYRRLLREHPRYRLTDGVHYLLGYSLGEMAKDAESRQAFLGLVCTNRYRPLDPPAPWPGRKLKADPFAGCEPQKGDSRFLAETWTRLGEQHFDRGELDAAIAAYGRVLAFRDSPFFDKALYKLAWSFYRADRFSDAVRRFDELVVFADKQSGSADIVEPRLRAKAAKRGGSTLRSESVQYLALCFAERDWNGDGKTDAEAGLPRLESFYRGRDGEPHVREVMVRLGDIWYERTEFARAAEAYKLAVARAPLSPDNPRLQERVVAAYDRLRSFEQALRAREALARDYAPGSRWYEENKDDAEALASAAELADASLLHAITNRHASAQELRKKALAAKGKPDGKTLGQAREGYRQAAESYGAYLKQHPQSKNAYEYSYLQAESLFYGGDYAEAAAAYARVRDADKNGSHLEEAAYGAVKAQEHVALGALRGETKAHDDPDDVSKLLDDKLPPLPALGKVKTPVVAMNPPAEVEALQLAYDRYVGLLPQAERAALMAYKSAELDFRYQRFDRARQRMSLVLDRYCQSDRAVDAGNAILVTHTIEGNLEQVESWSGRIAQRGCGAGGALAAEQATSLKKLSEDVSFKKAEQLLEAKRYAEAAAMFAAIVEKNPRSATADKALQNTAVAYESLKRYGTAGNYYERLARDYPQSPLADEAMFRAAVNQQRLYMFDKALLAYRAIATLPRYAKSPHRRDSLYNAALLADRDGDTALGIELWRQYIADKETAPKDAVEAAYRVAILTDRAALRTGNAQQAIDEWDRFIRRAAPHVEGDAQILARVVEAQLRSGRAQEVLHNPTDAREIYAKAVKLGQRLPPGSDGTEFAAHAAFLLAGRHLGELERLRIGGSGDELAQSISKFNSAVTVAIGDYEKVLTFRRATWTLAAYFRMGYVTELYAKALLAAPCPPEVRRLGEGACSLYRTKIEENVAQIEEKAVARYAVTIEQAGRFGVGNSWTKEARARLSAYRPDKYPLLHDEHIAQGLEAGSGPSSGAAGSPQAATLAEARAALSSRQIETAMVLARQVLSEDERNVPAILLLARAYYLRGKLDLASALVGAAQQIDANSGEAYLLLGMLSLAREDGDRIAATSAFKRATELDGNLGAAWHNLAAQYLHAKNYEQALAAAQRASALLFGAGSAGVQLNLGSALRGVGRHAEAEAVYRKTVELEPQLADGYWNLGVLYLDAPPFTQDGLLSQKRAAVQYLMRYQDLARDKRDEASENYLKEARSAVEREERKQKRKPAGGP